MTVVRSGRSFMPRLCPRRPRSAKCRVGWGHAPIPLRGASEMTCTKCGQTVPDGKSWCDACHGPAQFSSRELGLMRVDIRARILWGDPIKEIREAWLAKG